MTTKGLTILDDGTPQSAGMQQVDTVDTDGRLRVYVETYGCQMNVADTEIMHGVLQEAGYANAGEPSDADVIIVNTCAVRERAEERVFGRIGELTQYKNQRPGVIIGVTGCMAEHLREQIPARAAAVDMVVGPDTYRNLPEIIARHTGATLKKKASLDIKLDRDENYIGLDPVRRPSTTAWLTIMRGCDRFCTFCIVPYTRGREKCVPPSEIIRQAHAIADEGYREVSLLGQTVNSYQYDDIGFAELLRMIADVDGIERIRFTSPHPAEFDVNTIATMVEIPEVCPYVHLPVQSGDNDMLQSMRRDYTIEEYRDLVGRMRDAIPDLAVSTDVIVGFCGETEEQYEQTHRLMEDMRYDFAFMFKYSPREGTSAARKLTDDVSEEVKGRRLREIIDMQERISAEVYASKIGQEVEVLVEGPAKKSPGQVYGRGLDFKSVVFPGVYDANSLVRVRVTGSSPHTLFAEPI
jgi:tRNA-2-methylthio-N6-dimethylallyladenosine synthase